MCLRIHVEESVKQVLDTTSLFASMKFILSEKILLISMILMDANQVNKVSSKGDKGWRYLNYNENSASYIINFHLIIFFQLAFPVVTSINYLK